jgi:protein-disulfide isomerase
MISRMSNSVVFLLLLAVLLGGCSQKDATITVNAEDYAMLGDPDAPVTFIEYSDYQCPFCKKFTIETLPSIREEYVDNGKVRFIFKDFPLEIHKEARSAAVAAHCAGEQGRYYEYHDILFANSRNITRPNIVSWAGNMGLDADAFSRCLDDPDQMTKVEKSLQDARALGVRGTPTFTINGHLLAGAQPLAAFRQLIEAELKKDFTINASQNTTCTSDADCRKGMTLGPYCSRSRTDETCTTEMTPTCKLPGTVESSCVSIVVEECQPCPEGLTCKDGNCTERGGDS